MPKVVLIAVDSSPQQQAVIAAAAEFATECSSDLHVVSVNDPARHWELGIADPTTAPFDVLDHDVIATLEAAVRQLAERGLPCHTHARTGLPAEEIARLAVEISADLIVIGHRHLSWVGRLIDRSVGRDLLDRAPCNVLIVSERENTYPE
ncbi:universal stress protein [Magnetospirillum molischianum]|nr:universal stress protein [Magnetospirillum molischianum]